jgi:hypothetical protein
MNKKFECQKSWSVNTRKKEEEEEEREKENERKKTRRKTCKIKIVSRMQVL